MAGSRITPKSDPMSGTQRLTGAQVEELAIVFVTEYERRQGRVPVDTRHVPQAVGHQQPAAHD